MHVQDDSRRSVGLRIFWFFVPLSLVWEVMQLPLYTIWHTADWRSISFDVLHCTAGDVIIFATCLFLSVIIAGRDWPHTPQSRRRIMLLATAMGITYTIFSEWLNVSVRGSWAYTPLMPLLPYIGTGLSPVLQWVLVPPIAMRLGARQV